MISNELDPKGPLRNIRISQIAEMTFLNSAIQELALQDSMQPADIQMRGNVCRIFQSLVQTEREMRGARVELFGSSVRYLFGLLCRGGIYVSYTSWLKHFFHSNALWRRVEVCGNRRQDDVFYFFLFYINC